MINIKYLIDVKLKNGSTLQGKEFRVYAKNEKDAQERIALCLNNDEKTDGWKIVGKNKGKVVVNKRHMLGVWYGPYE